MAKSKWPQVRDNLILIEKWARDGLTEDQMCKNLRVAKSSFEKYKLDYSELKDALKKGKQVFIAEVENALAKRALGFEYEEVKTYIKDDDGKTTRFTEKTKKYQAPDVGACAILLKNKDRGNWSNDPMKLELEKEMLELHKKAQELKVW